VTIFKQLVCIRFRIIIIITAIYIKIRSVRVQTARNLYKNKTKNVRKIRQTVGVYSYIYIYIYARYY